MKSLLKAGLAEVVGGAKKAARDRDALVVLSFHALVRNRSELFAGHLEPFQLTTNDILRECIEYYLSCGYRFVSPVDLKDGTVGGPGVMLTFDDGYANNLGALNALAEFGVPATFFISTGHVRNGRAFWWDVLYREQSAAGKSYAEIQSTIRDLKRRRYEEIENSLREAYGPGWDRPCGDTDRPMDVGELAEFAASPWVHIGNHTRDHAILTTCGPDDARLQIEGAQQDLTALLGAAPIAIAYPNGNATEEIARVAARAGLALGFTMEAGKTPLPLSGSSRMLIGRFMPDGFGELRRSLLAYRVDSPRLRRWISGA